MSIEKSQNPTLLPQPLELAPPLGQTLPLCPSKEGGLGRFGFSALSFFVIRPSRFRPECDSESCSGPVPVEVDRILFSPLRLFRGAVKKVKTCPKDLDKGVTESLFAGAHRIGEMFPAVGMRGVRPLQKAKKPSSLRLVAHPLPSHEVPIWHRPQ
ncbi:hypothetical protein A3F37_02020 [Candidatus Saccharibacteria bacterium RIFCSPHIGHO2_12_FULL_41_12]|nr:MAG: hypothetical protein A3F37_02020 [Candidatus Saccharibacteria bacterium RIFCSPHIGHO2_12_FULL_41_12]